MFVVTWLLSVKRGAYMMVEVSLMLGVLIPMVAGKVCFGESVRPTAWLGMAALVAATVIMGSYNQAQSRKLDAAGVLLLVVCGVANGLSDFSQKLFVRTLPELPIAVFNFYTYVFSALVLLPSLLLFARRSAAAATERPLLANILGYVIVMSVCLFANAYFRTKAAVYLDAAQLYPLSQGSALILSTLMAAIAFREKVTPTCVVGLAVAFAGLLLINVV